LIFCEESYISINFIKKLVKKMGKQIKKRHIQFSHVVMRRKIVKTIGLDTSVFVDMALKEPMCYIHNAKIIKRGGLYVSYYVIQEAWGILVHIKKVDKRKAGLLINRFIERNKIEVIRKKDITETQVNSYFDLLKKQEEVNKNIQIKGSKDSDLMIISIYKTANIDCIFTRNTFDFQKACEYLDIEIERQLTDTQFMLKKLR